MHYGKPIITKTLTICWLCELNVTEYIQNCLLYDKIYEILYRRNIYIFAQMYTRYIRYQLKATLK